MKDEIVRRTKSLRKPSDKKPGGQRGHDGHKLSCSSIPDEIIDGYQLLYSLRRIFIRRFP